MAVGTPWAIDGTTIPGKELRQLLQSLLGGTVGAFAGGVSASDRAHGIVVSTDLAVTQKGTPNMSVDVSSGSAFVRGTEAATQGVMWAYNDATTNLVIAAADATNPRRDLVVLQLRDDDYSGAFRDARLFVVQGTPAASPADPTPPANSLVLARVTVAALAASIVNANITDLRRRAGGLGGVVVTTSSTRPTTGLYAGMEIFETDTGRVLTWDGAAWQRTGWTSAAGRTGFTVSRAAVQSIPNNVITAVAWDTESFDSDGFGILNPLYTIPAGLGGLYAVTAVIQWAVFAGTASTHALAINGVLYNTTAQGNAAASVSATLPLAAGATLGASVYQNTGGAINLSTASLTAYRLGL